MVEMTVCFETDFEGTTMRKTASTLITDVLKHAKMKSTKVQTLSAI